MSKGLLAGIAAGAGGIALLASVDVCAAETLEEVLVTAGRISYRNAQASSVGIPTPLLETPRALQIVTAQSWEGRSWPRHISRTSPTSLIYTREVP